MNLNPNHPVSKEIAGQWHKIVALIMIHFGIKEFRITDAMIKNLPSDLAIAFDVRFRHSGDAIVRIVSMAEAEALAKNAGGLPH